MTRIIVDSGSSIKQSEKEQYDIDILPLQVQIGEQSFLDGVDLTTENFYNYLESGKEFPKTSLPCLEDAASLIKHYTEQGDDVLVLTISSEISGTFQSLRALFSDDPHVLIYDSRLAVGGIRFLVEEANRYREHPLPVIKKKLDLLLPRIEIMAIPATLDYLVAGGRLSKAQWMLGTLLSIRPIIGFRDGKVAVLMKKRGDKQAMGTIVKKLEDVSCDPQYGIIAAYTKNQDNVAQLIDMLTPEERKNIRIYDDLIPSIACHWGPNAFGFIFVRGE